MEEIAKMLKSFGPHYNLRWVWEYEHGMIGLRMILTYAFPTLDYVVAHDHFISSEDVENFNEYGPRILEEMHYKIIGKSKEMYRKV